MQHSPSTPSDAGAWPEISAESQPFSRRAWSSRPASFRSACAHPRNPNVRLHRLMQIHLGWYLVFEFRGGRAPPAIRRGTLSGAALRSQRGYGFTIAPHPTTSPDCCFREQRKQSAKQSPQDGPSRPRQHHQERHGLSEERQCETHTGENRESAFSSALKLSIQHSDCDRDCIESFNVGVGRTD